MYKSDSIFFFNLYWANMVQINYGYVTAGVPLRILNFNNSPCYIQ